MGGSGKRGDERFAGLGSSLEQAVLTSPSAHRSTASLCGVLAVSTRRGVTAVGRGRASAEEALARIARSGELRLPKGKGLEDIEPVRVRGGGVSDTLLEDRG